MKKAFVLIGFCLIATACAATHKTYTIYKMSNPPELNGTLADPAWAALPEGRGFITMKGRYVLSRQTFFKMGWYQDSLYIGIRCEEPTPKKINAMDSYRDGLVSDESIEFFIMKPDGKFLQMIANARGARWCRWEGDRKEAAAPPEWKVETHLKENAWTMEMAIPFSMFDKDHSLSSQYRFNICRTATLAPAKEKYSCWATAKTGFADKKTFETLLFSNFSGPADVNMKSGEINSDYDNFLYTTLQQIALKKGFFKDIRARNTASPLLDKFDALQQKIAETYLNTPKNELIGLYCEWVDMVNKISVNRRLVEFLVNERDVKNFKLFLNGKEVFAKNNVFKAHIKEGLSTIAISAVASGDNPSVQIAVKGLPETATRWRVSNVETANWQQVKFNDNNWPIAQPGQDGNIWSRSGSQKLFMRQTLIWNKRYDGLYRCLNPYAQVWEFSQNAMELMYLSLYSPVEHKIGDYNFFFEVPEGFKLLDMQTDVPTHKTNISPEKVTQKKIVRDGKNFVQYKLTYPASLIHEWQSYDSLLPIVNKSLNNVGQQGNIRYFRQVNGNITEIPGDVPYKIIPQINGKMPKKVKISFYVGYGLQPISDEARTHLVNDASKAGFNYWIIYPWNSKPLKLHKDLIRKNNGRICLTHLNYPIWGAVKKSELAKLLQNTPELQARYFKNVPAEEARKMGKKHAGSLPRYCESMALGKYRKEFVDAITKDYRDMMFGQTPDAEAFFLNYEYDAWVNENTYYKAKRGEGATCFCKTCIDAFRKHARIPADQNLTEDDIFNNYYYEWEKYCYSQHAKIHKIVNDVIRGLGKTGLFYSGTHHYPYWEAAGKIHTELFPGSPGNAEINGNRQKLIDDHRNYFKKICGDIPLTGQRFSMFRNTYFYNFNKRNGWRKFKIMSEDGILHPESWKRQTLRMCATFGGGYDLQSPYELTAGMKYYIGEGTRLVADYEDIFWANNRQDNLVESKDIAYPDSLVLVKGDQRIILLFNETNKAKTVTIRNKELKPKQTALLYYQNKTIVNPENMTVTIPANDVVAIIIK